MAFDFRRVCAAVRQTARHVIHCRQAIRLDDICTIFVPSYNLRPVYSMHLSMEPYKDERPRGGHYQHSIYMIQDIGQIVEGPIIQYPRNDRASPTYTTPQCCAGSEGNHYQQSTKTQKLKLTRV
jgi:hypothetical protein